uniref:Conserved protein n=1 Tax=Haptophyceae sp. NIES-3900 TaxID=2748608 RepID=A0A7R6WDT6_9EUKA|nr:conserved protein [Haptophyceae sp. NIES-3900]
MSLLIVGGTGTLGRQIVRRALDEGYSVRCLVRNLRKATFLKEWGAELVYGDLNLPETLPLTLEGCSAVIDASTLRSIESYTTENIDWRGKIALIEASKVAKIKRFIFFSFKSTDNFSNVPLINLKVKLEKYLINSGLPYTVFYLPGFFQGLITQYAIPILEKQSIWLTGDTSSISYMDTQDIARFVTKSLVLPSTKNNIYTLEGPSSWTSADIVNLCEKLSGRKSKIQRIPLLGLSFVKQFLRGFQWSWNISDRLAFTEVLSTTANTKVDMMKTYDTFGFSPTEILTLEKYFQEYFGKMLEKLKLLNYDQNQKRRDITF